MASQQIRAGGLDGAQRRQPFLRHRLDRFGNGGFGETVRMHDERRLLGPQRAGERLAVETAAGEIAVQVGERRQRAGLVHAKDRIVRRASAAADRVRESRDRVVGEHRRERQRVAGLALDRIDQPRREERVSADLEEAVVHADANAQEVAPEIGEHALEHVARLDVHAMVRLRGVARRGSARRSTLPFALSGSFGIQTIAPGSMYSGRRLRRSRSRFGGAVAGSAGTT